MEEEKNSNKQEEEESHSVIEVRCNNKGEWRGVLLERGKEQERERGRANSIMLFITCYLACNIHCKFVCGQKDKRSQESRMHHYDDQDTQNHVCIGKVYLNLLLQCLASCVP